ncbi:L-idonate 5-dehydrogenase-like isoform X1 [Durio zibethinus]|uniref:L-idonate 5-dehydrogenase-like isoform X1 n=1 Tax=Durio zibethinus TaxID=66656 RepID=A0A6P5YAJ5_DURZI|nr:L-idonate 5-dehydrogenase-like isoform X1 [Durio zibethinus]
MAHVGEIQVDEDDGENNMAAWLLGIKTLKIQPYHLPPLAIEWTIELILSYVVEQLSVVLGPHDVKVGIKALGICGSDVHHFKTMRCANFIVKKPMVIGHECAGIIEEVGSEVKSLAVGDRVALEPGISCQRCNLCRDGRYNLCPEMKFFGSPPTNGSLANKVVHPANLCFKLPENVSLEEGAMCEPLSVGVHACRRAEVGPETNVLIMGAGPIGLVTLLAARAFGSPRIVIVDVDDCRLSIAKNLGADEIVQVSTNIQDMGEEVAKIQNAMASKIDVSFDCVGFNKTMSTALNATGTGGKVCLIGLAQSEMTIPLTMAAVREVDVIGIFRYRNTWPLCIEFLRTGKIDVKPLITHRFGFSQKGIEDAFQTSAAGGNAIKVMFNL